MQVVKIFLFWLRLKLNTKMTLDHPPPQTFQRVLSLEKKLRSIQAEYLVLLILMVVLFLVEFDMKSCILF